MEKIFGTDGIRGVANAGNLKIEFLLKLVPAIIDKYHPKQIIIGKDTRISGDMLVYALASIFNSYGADVTFVGVISTPGLAYVTNKSGFDLGIMISASHNPYQDNGIKIFNKNGQKLSTKEEDIIADTVSFAISKPATHSTIGQTTIKTNLVDQYKDFIASLFSELKISNYKIVVDCANGSLSDIAKDVLDKFSENIAYIANTPNGININDNCGVLYPNTLATEVLKRGADFGIAFDGDGDRVLFCDEKGVAVDGDQLIGLIASETKNVQSVAVTKISNFALDKFLDSHNISVVRTEVGDKYIAQEISAQRAQLGGEKSGHIIVNRGLNTGDGLISSCAVMEILRELDGPASKALRPFELYPSIQKNVPTKDKGIIDTEEFQAFMTQYTGDKDIRVLVRKSGTENMIRILVEGNDTDKLKRIISEIESELKKCM